MTTLAITIVLIGGSIILLAAAAQNMSTYSSYRLGEATEMEVRQSQRGLVTTVVIFVVAMAAMPLVLWLTSDFFSSNSLAGESEEATTTPATSEPAQDEE